MPLMITRKPVYKTGADMNIYVLPEEWSAYVPKKNFWQRCIRRLRFGTGGNYAHYVFYTGAVDFLAFQKDYEKLLKYAVCHGHKTVAVSCDDEIAFMLANKFSKRFAEKKNLQILLCLSENVEISGSSITRLERILWKTEKLTSSVQPLGEENCSTWEKTDFAPPPMPEVAYPQSKASQLQSKKAESQKINDSCPEPLKAKPNGSFRDLQEFLKKNDAGFKDTLLKYIDRTGKKDSAIYKKANVDRRLFSKIMNIRDYNPSKPTAIAFAIALELNLEETKDLIGRAGYTLSQANTFDRIIEFFILERNYDIYEINEALFYFDQSLLGC